MDPRICHEKQSIVSLKARHWRVNNTTLPTITTGTYNLDLLIILPNDNWGVYTISLRTNNFAISDNPLKQVSSLRCSLLSPSLYIVIIMTIIPPQG